ncbi:MAG: hypothetical protein HYX74_08085 [Acidobacteria bacterium]|nr:hypothetical protein [Acidobacteriota bacterium]
MRGAIVSALAFFSLSLLARPQGLRDPLFGVIDFHPQAAVGQLGADRISETVFLSNLSSKVCAGTLTYTDGAGHDPGTRILTNGNDAGMQVPFTLPPMGTASFLLEAPPGSPVETFGLLLQTNDRSCAGQVKSQARFTIEGSSREVFSSPVQPFIFSGNCGKFPIHLRSGTDNAGVAVIGFPPGQAFPSGAEICKRVFDNSGSPVTNEICFPYTGAHSAANVTEIFPDLAGRSSLLGTMQVCLRGADPNQFIAATGIGTHILGGGVQLSGTEVAATNPDCAPGEKNLCLQDNRFRVTVDWESPTSSGSATGHERPDDTGLFYFFTSSNVEVVVKVLNACPINNRYWVFAGGLTDVRTVITVTDTQRKAVKTYINPQGTPFQPVQDTSAFATCP